MPELSCEEYKKSYGGRSSVGRAPGCDPGCRGFEPHRSPHFVMLFSTPFLKYCTESLQEKYTVR